MSGVSAAALRSIVLQTLRNFSGGGRGTLGQGSSSVEAKSNGELFPLL